MPEREVRLGARQALRTAATSDPSWLTDLGQEVIDECALPDPGLTGDGDKLTNPCFRCFECSAKSGTFTLAADTATVCRDIRHGRRPCGEPCQTCDNVGGGGPQGRVLLKHLEEQVIELCTAT